MVERVKSFSKSGAIIERILQLERYQIGQQQLNKMLQKKGGRGVKSKKKKLQIAGFDKVPGRNTLSSFQLHNVKDNNGLSYNWKKEAVLTRNGVLPIRVEKDQRLSQLFKKDNYGESNQQCKKVVIENYQHIKTAKDLMENRKTFHSYDFAKQTGRPFNQKLKQMEKTIEDNILTRTQSQRHVKSFYGQLANSFNKQASVHSFTSYTKRDFLSEKKLIRAPAVSGIDSFKINPQKYKGQWKVVGNIRFDKVADKHLSRYDRDSDPWYTKLDYNVKNRSRNPSRPGQGHGF